MRAWAGAWADPWGWGAEGAGPCALASGSDDPEPEAGEALAPLALEAALRRAATPLRELAEDASGSACSAARGAAAALGGWLGELGLPDEQAFWRDGWGRARAPLAELSEDAGLGAGCAGLAVPGALATLAGPVAAAAPSAALTLCGLSATTKGLYLALSVCMAGGAWSMLNRHPDENDRVVQRRSAAALACSGGFHLMLAASGGLPHSIAVHLAHPDVVAHFLQDLVVYPLIVWNTGYLAGQSTEQMMPTVAFTFLGTTGFAAAAAVPSPTRAAGLLGVGALCMAKAAYDLNRVLPNLAGSLAALNKLRTQISADLLVFAWMGYPLAEGAGLARVVTTPFQLHTFVVLDVLSKIGVCHIILKNQDALTTATQGFQAAATAQGAQGAQGQPRQ